MANNLKTIVLLMRHMEYTTKQIEEELDDHPDTIHQIIKDHENRYTPERRGKLRNRRRKFRQDRARRERLAQQQRELAPGGMSFDD